MPTGVFIRVNNPPKINLNGGNFGDDITEYVNAPQEDLLVDELVVIVQQNLERRRFVYMCDCT